MIGEKEVKLFGRYFDVRARIENLDLISGHSDREEILQWLRQLDAPPKHSFVTHGEGHAADSFRMAISDQLGWPASNPEHGEQVTL